MAEALGNILKNCGEHTPPGGAITLSFTDNPLYARIDIADTGEGINPADIPRLFERFYRGQNAAPDSVGIGLAMAQAIVSRQGGVIEAANRPEGGALFTIRLYKAVT